MLFAIDLQNDYFDPKGKFYIPSAEGIKKRLVDRLQRAVDTGEITAYTKNIYPEDEYRERSAEVIQWAEDIYPAFKALLRQAEKFEKIHYGIAPVEALKFRTKFEHRKADYESIEFIGVETNVCVLSNVIIVQNIFPDSGLKISPERTAASDPELHRQAINTLAGLKVEVLTHES